MNAKILQSQAPTVGNLAYYNLDLECYRLSDDGAQPVRVSNSELPTNIANGGHLAENRNSLTSWRRPQSERCRIFIHAGIEGGTTRRPSRSVNSTKLLTDTLTRMKVHEMAARSTPILKFHFSISFGVHATLFLDPVN